MHQTRIERLKFIAEIIQSASQPSLDDKKGHHPIGLNETKGITFDQIQHAVSNKFGTFIKERQLRKDIEFLRNEGYDGVPWDIKIKDSRYFVKENLGLNLVRLSDAEKATIPFVLELLNTYKEIPAVNRIWNTLINPESEFKFYEDTARVVEFGYPHFQMKSTVASKIEKFLLAIQQQYAVVFNYTNVAIGASSNSGIRDSVYKEQQIYPLQIRSHLGRFYIIGALFKLNPTPADIRIFPIDAIGRGPEKHEIDVPFEEDDQTLNQEFPEIHFEWNSLVKRTGLKDYYSNSIGIYRNYSVNKETIPIIRWFIGWAANWVKEYPIHRSQQEITIDHMGNLKIKIEVYDTPDLENFFARFGEFCITHDEYELKFP